MQIAQNLSLPRFSIENYASTYCNVKTNTGKFKKKTIPQRFDSVSRNLSPSFYLLTSGKHKYWVFGRFLAFGYIFFFTCLHLFAFSKHNLLISDCKFNLSPIFQYCIKDVVKYKHLKHFTEI